MEENPYKTWVNLYNLNLHENCECLPLLKFKLIKLFLQTN